MINLSEDKLNRSEFLNDLFNLFDNFGNYDDGGLTISLNGKFGSGKSTLLNFIEEKNQSEQKYHIVKYDAWQNNLFNNPLIPILYSLNELESTKSKIKEGAKNIIKSLPKILTNTVANIHGPDLSPLITNENIFDDYKKHIQAVAKYKSILNDFCKNKKVILLIDELDRCLPEYQIKVLETLYNVFNIPNLILVIAIDKQQLEFTIKNIFGNQENVSGYLSKFIQYEIDLPENENNEYLKTLILFQCKYSEIKNICADMFDVAKVSIRDCLQIVKELNLICNEHSPDGKPLQYFYWYPLFVCFILIIKKQHREIYKKYFYNSLINEGIVEQKPLDETLYQNFLNDIKNTNIEDVIHYYTSSKMNFAFILYWINYFYPIKNIELNSLVNYTHYNQKRIESIIDNYDTPMWNQYEYNKTLDKIKIFK